MAYLKRIFVIILNYNNEVDTIECINSLESIKGYDLQLVIVDNKSKNPKILEDYVLGLPNAIFLQTGENLGYAGGNNVGIRYAIEHQADYIAILNNDVIVNQDSFSEAMNILDLNEKAAFAGPSIIGFENDTIQSQGDLVNFWLLSKSKAINRGKKFEARAGFNECSAIIGACMIFKPSIVDKIGYIPEDYFLYYEELDWCHKAYNLGYKSYCSLSNYVRHKGSATVDCYNNLSFYYRNRNIVIFLLKRDPIKLRAVYSIALLFVKAIVKTLIGYKGKHTNKYLLFCYVDGLLRTTRFKDYICSRGLIKKK